MTATTTPTSRSTQQQRPPKPRFVLGPVMLGIIVVAAAWAWTTADIDLARLLRAPDRLIRTFGLMFLPPDLPEFTRSFPAMMESVQMAWLGTVLAAVLSLPLSLLAAVNVSGRFGSGATRQVLNAIRAFPELVLVILIVTIFGLGPVTGTLALGLHSIGTLGKLSSESVEAIDKGPLEAVDAVGGTWLQKMRWGVLPQAMPEIMAFWLYRFEVNIRASAVLGVVGAGGIGALLVDYLNYKEFARAGTAFIVVVGVTLVVDTISSAVRRRIIAGSPGRHEDEDQDGTDDVATEALA